MKKTTGMREMSRAMKLELLRDEAERLEQERIDFEHRARMARTTLYNNGPLRDQARGWVDARRK